MNTAKYISLLMILLALIWTAQAEDPNGSVERRLDEIKNDLKIRRESREKAMSSAGIVCVPEFRPHEWYDLQHEIELENMTVAVCAQLYATLSKKEVMVSGKIVKQRVNIPIHNLSVNEAIVAIGRALADIGVAVHQIDDDTVAWSMNPRANQGTPKASVPSDVEKRDGAASRL